VRDLACRERLRNHAGDLTTTGEHRVGQHAHEPDCATTIDEPDVTAGQLTGKGSGRMAELRRGAST
jgi:hypothetical protein